jgi:hypothetical protein
MTVAVAYTNERKKMFIMSSDVQGSSPDASPFSYAYFYTEIAFFTAATLNIKYSYVCGVR